jgi:hypothetical protein
MNSIFDKEACADIIKRIENLTPASQAQWGKMNVSQMMAHCTHALESASGKTQPKRVFLGLIMGKLFRSTFSSDKPFPKNGPTHPTFIVSDEREFNKEKTKLVAELKAFSEGGEAKCTSHPHSFFGPITPLEWSKGMYKHMDHHLQQFGV